MSFCVLDSSIALSWVLPSENDASMGLLDDITAKGALAPVLWPLEVANVLLMAERRRRITPTERSRASAWFAVLPVEISNWRFVVGCLWQYSIRISQQPAVLRASWC